jgi:hypothetical protein
LLTRWYAFERATEGLKPAAKAARFGVEIHEVFENVQLFAPVEHCLGAALIARLTRHSFKSR